jgi:hypothetical protein
MRVLVLSWLSMMLSRLPLMRQANLPTPHICIQAHFLLLLLHLPTPHICIQAQTHTYIAKYSRTLL